MLQQRYILCLIFLCLGVAASAQSANSTSPLKAGVPTQSRSNAPRLTWKASLPGKESVRFAGAGSGRIAVLVEPASRMENGVYIPPLPDQSAGRDRQARLGLPGRGPLPACRHCADLPGLQPTTGRIPAWNRRARPGHRAHTLAARRHHQRHWSDGHQFGRMARPGSGPTREQTMRPESAHGQNRLDGRCIASGQKGSYSGSTDRRRRPAGCYRRDQRSTGASVRLHAREAT